MSPFVLGSLPRFGGFPEFYGRIYWKPVDISKNQGVSWGYPCNPSIDTRFIPTKPNDIP
jgi:hypothetical protein